MRYLFSCVALIVAFGFPSRGVTCTLTWTDAIALEWAVETPTGRVVEWHEQWRPVAPVADQFTWQVVARDEAGSLVYAQEIVCSEAGVSLYLDYQPEVGVVRVFDPPLPLGRVHLQDTLGQVFAFALDGSGRRGRPYTAVSGPGSVTVREYDHGGAVIRMTQVDFVPLGWRPPLERARTRLVRDSAGERVWVMSLIGWQRLALESPWPVSLRKRGVAIEPP